MLKELKLLSGRLAENEIARTEWLREGSIPSYIELISIMVLPKRLPHMELLE